MIFLLQPESPLLIHRVTGDEALRRGGFGKNAKLRSEGLKKFFLLFDNRIGRDMWADCGLFNDGLKSVCMSAL
ncbi:MAG: hypothetical protein ACJA1L_002917 [Paracoccaceae bacterium]